MDKQKLIKIFFLGQILILTFWVLINNAKPTNPITLNIPTSWLCPLNSAMTTWMGFFIRWVGQSLTQRRLIGTGDGMGINGDGVTYRAHQRRRSLLSADWTYQRTREVLIGMIT